MKKLTTISDVRLFFHRNERPIYFISATNFNLLGIDEWVQHFKFISYIDCFDGRHPNVFVPTRDAARRSSEASRTSTTICSQHKEVIDFIKGRGGKPVAVFLMFDEKTEALAQGARLRGLVSPRPTAPSSTTRWRRCASATRPACLGAQRAGQGRKLRPSCASSAQEAAWRRSGGADRLRRFRPHDLLHLQRSGLARSTPRRSPASARSRS